MINVTHVIAKNDINPSIFAVLSADIDEKIPEQYHTIYSDGDVLKFQYKRGKDVIEKDVEVLEDLDEGKSILVKVDLDTSDTQTPGRYQGRFKNTTKSLTFPNDSSYVELYVVPTFP